MKAELQKAVCAGDTEITGSWGLQHGETPWLCILRSHVSLLLDKNPVLSLFLLQKIIPLQPPSPIIIPTDEKCSQSGDVGMKEEKEKPYLQSLPKSPQCFDLLSENTLAQQTIANYPVAR